MVARHYQQLAGVAAQSAAALPFITNAFSSISNGSQAANGQYLADPSNGVMRSSDNGTPSLVTATGAFDIQLTTPANGYQNNRYLQLWDSTGTTSSIYIRANGSTTNVATGASGAYSASGSTSSGAFSTTDSVTIRLTRDASNNIGAFYSVNGGAWQIPPAFSAAPISGTMKLGITGTLNTVPGACTLVLRGTGWS